MKTILIKIKCKKELPKPLHKGANISINVFTNEGRCFYNFDKKTWFSYEITRVNKYVKYWYKEISVKKIIL